MSNDQKLKSAVTIQFHASDYLQVAEWSDEDCCYVGSAPPLVGQSLHTRLRVDVADLFCELDEIAEEYLQIHAEDGFPVPPPCSAEVYYAQFLTSPGKQILRCRLLDASWQIISDGMFQNLSEPHKPSFMPLPRIGSLGDANRSQGAYLRFSSTLIVPIVGLGSLSNGAFEILGYLEGATTESISLSSDGKPPVAAFRLI